MTNENRNYIAWIPVIELAVLAFTTLGTTITLFLHSDAKTEAFRKECLAASEEFRKESLALHREIVQERKDFQNRWMEETKDFHGRLIAIEERKGK